jgi:O-antigen/teichoic acid export membrane protein
MVGVGGFGFLVVVGHTTSVTAKAALSALYLIGNVAGPGLFAGLEQETSRVVSSGLAAGIDPRPGLRRAAAVGVGLAGVAMLVLLALAPLLVPRSFAGHAGLMLWLLLGVVGSAEVYLVRGILGGTRRFGGYAVTLAVEGLARLLPCLAVAALGVTNVNVYGLIFAGATGAAAAAAYPWLRHGGLLPEPAPTPVSASASTAAATAAGAVVAAGHSMRGIVRGVAFLGVATLLAQLVANLAPLVVTGRMLGSGPDELAAVAFGFAFVLTRAPLLLFSPVQALLLPRLTTAVVRGELDVVRAQVRLGLGAVAVVALGGVVAAGVAGPWAVQTLFGSEARPSALVMALLGVSTGLLMVVQLLQPVLVAVGRHRTASMAWIVGTAVLVGLLVLPGPAITAALVAQLTAAVTVALVSVLGLLDILRTPPAVRGEAAGAPSLLLTECVPAATERALEPS